jgi:hypothetical protein
MVTLNDTAITSDGVLKFGSQSSRNLKIKGMDIIDIIKILSKQHQIYFDCEIGSEYTIYSQTVTYNNASGIFTWDSVSDRVYGDYDLYVIQSWNGKIKDGEVVYDQLIASDPREQREDEDERTYFDKVCDQLTSNHSIVPYYKDESLSLHIKRVGIHGNNVTITIGCDHPEFEQHEPCSDDEDEDKDEDDEDKDEDDACLNGCIVTLQSAANKLNMSMDQLLKHLNKRLSV